MLKKFIFGLILLFSIFNVSCGKKEEPINNEPIVTHDVYYIDGVSCIYIESVEHGKCATYEAPIKDDYNFIGWDQDLSCVTDDIEVNAIYEKKSYTVTFIDQDGKLIDTCKVEIHDNAKAPAYSVTGYNVTWDHELKDIVSDLTVKAICTPKKYCVRFYGLNDVLLDTQYVEYKKGAVAPDAPVVDRYEFNRWDQSYCCIEDDLDVYAQYIKITGLVSFKVLGEVVSDIDLKSYQIGTKVSLPSYSKAGYDFIGWRLSEKSFTIYDEITSDMSGDYCFEACLVETIVHTPLEDLPATYKITNINKNRYTNDSSQKEYKLFLYSPDISETGQASVTAFDWTTSNEQIAKVSQWGSITALSSGYCYLIGTLKSNPGVTVNCIIYCSYDGISVATLEQANTKTLVDVTFVDDNDQVISTQRVEYNGSAILPSAPLKDGYRFNGWDHVNYGIKTNTTFKATYVEGTDYYSGKSFAVIGDSISTWYGNIPDGYAYFYPYPTADFNNINQTWWMQTINNLGGTLFIDNSYSGSCVAGNNASAAANIDRLKTTLLQGETPDVIIIYMGSNDIRAYAAANFKVAYRKMLNSLKELCPNSEIILLELPTSLFYDTTKMNDYNDVINAMGEEFDLTVIKTHNVDVSNDLIDSVHPLFNGHTLLANYITKSLRSKNQQSGNLPWI